MLNEDEDPAEAMQPERVWQLLERWVTPDAATLWRAATYRFHAVVAPEWRRGRVILAGDAAHQQPPFLGQGMCQGIRDAGNLCWRLDLALRGLVSDALLDSYGVERSDHVTRLISVIKTLGRFVCERDVGKARARDDQLIGEMGGKVVTTYRQDIMPALTRGLLSADECAGRGWLIPQPRLVDGRLLDEATGLGFRLFIAGDAPPVPIGSEKALPGLKIIRVGEAQALGPMSDGTACFSEADGVLNSWLKTHGVMAALVRPDNYVYGTATDLAGVPALLSQCWTELTAGLEG